MGNILLLFNTLFKRNELPKEIEDKFWKLFPDCCCCNSFKFMGLFLEYILYKLFNLFGT